MVWLLHVWQILLEAYVTTLKVHGMITREQFLCCSRKRATCFFVGRKVQCFALEPPKTMQKFPRLEDLVSARKKNVGAIQLLCFFCVCMQLILG